MNCQRHFHAHINLLEMNHQTNFSVIFWSVISGVRLKYPLQLPLPYSGLFFPIFFFLLISAF